MHDETEKQTKWLVAVGLLTLTLGLSAVGRSGDPEPAFPEPVEIVFPDLEPDDALIFLPSND